MTRRLRIAVASTQGTTVDGHFGSAPRFLIYQVGLEAIRLVGVRSTVEADAAEADARGDGPVAERLRARAAVMRSRQHEVAPKEGAVLIGADSVVGAPAVSEPTSKKAPVIPIFSKKSPALAGLPPAPAFGSISAVSTPSTAGANALAPAPSTGASPLAGLRSGAWLDGQVFAPLEYHVPGLITEGCGIIAGPPKVGKSWFVLAIALAIAAGNSALGCIDCVARPVLYLALEDGWRRLRARSRQLLGDGSSIPAGIEFMLDVPEGATAVSVITEWLALYPGQKPFVIVDTLGKTRGAGPKSGASAYQEDYKAVGDLKRCVDAVPGSGMLIVHHTRKAEVGKGGRSADFVEELAESDSFGAQVALERARAHSELLGDQAFLRLAAGQGLGEVAADLLRDAAVGVQSLEQSIGVVRQVALKGPIGAHELQLHGLPRQEQAAVRLLEVERAGEQLLVGPQIRRTLVLKPGLKRRAADSGQGVCEHEERDHAGLAGVRALGEAGIDGSVAQFEVAVGRMEPRHDLITAHQAAVALKRGERLTRRAAQRDHVSGQTQRRRAEAAAGGESQVLPPDRGREVLAGGRVAPSGSGYMVGRTEEVRMRRQGRVDGLAGSGVGRRQVSAPASGYDGGARPPRSR